MMLIAFQSSPMRSLRPIREWAAVERKWSCRNDSTVFRYRATSRRRKQSRLALPRWDRIRHDLIRIGVR